MEKKKFRELFPHLAYELVNGKSVADQKNEPIGPKRFPQVNRKWEGYDPDIIDFIRRCKIPEQVTQIIDYMSKQGKVSPEIAEKLEIQLEEKGIRSFGKYKQKGFYHRNTRWIDFLGLRQKIFFNSQEPGELRS